MGRGFTKHGLGRDGKGVLGVMAGRLRECVGGVLGMGLGVCYWVVGWGFKGLCGGLGVGLGGDRFDVNGVVWVCWGGDWVETVAWFGVSRLYFVTLPY